MSGRCIPCCVDGVCLRPEAPWHGSVGGYTNHDCRCTLCAREHTAYFRAGSPGFAAKQRYRDKLIAQGLTTRGTPRKNKYTPRRSRVKVVTLWT